MARLRSDFWVSAYFRRCAVEGVDAVLRRRGSPEAGAIFVKLDHRDGTASLFGPAPQSLIGLDASERQFTATMTAALPPDVEERMKREVRFDPDLWLIEVDDPLGRHFLDLASDEPMP